MDVDPEAMKTNDITLNQVMQAIKGSNIDVGAQTMEINLVEYFVRGIGYVQNISDIEKSVIKVIDNVPIRIGDVAHVSIGPAARRGVLDKSGAEAVGGVVVARYGANPLEVIQNVKAKIIELQPGLASKVLADGTESQVHIVPFYDRADLIHETIGTLQEALTLEILITIIVVILMLLNLKSSLLVSGTLPIAVLMCFIAMKYFGVEANIVALSGIAIAIGTMVDMGIVLTESMVHRIEKAPPEESLLTTIYEATMEVASAVITAVATTVISFLPVFTMQASEGKLFRPLAYTKTFALVASIIVAITIIPSLAHSFFSMKSRKKMVSLVGNGLAIIAGAIITLKFHGLLGSILLIVGIVGLINILIQNYSSTQNVSFLSWITNIIYALVVAWLLASIWMPLGVAKSNLNNFWFIVSIAGGLIAVFYVIIHYYERILRFLLRFKFIFLIVVGFVVYQGFIVFQNTSEEFMPSLDEGSFLLMPTSMPHAGMQENIKNLRLLDMAVTAIPEVESVVGKAGRVNSPLDPAPMSMYENVILYKSEYRTDESGHRIRFKFENGNYIRDKENELIGDPKGQYFRQWRDHIKSSDDIWNEIVKATKLPGVTSAPKLQPIETRLIMLQTGMRAPMGIKVQGQDLEAIESFGMELEKHLKDVEGVKDAAVFADRIVGKPYLLLDINREAISRHGLSVQQVQQHIQAAIGGMHMTTTVEGRERYSIRIRYPRELRDDPEALKRIYVSTSSGQQIPLGDLVDIRYEAGAQSIKSEDGFLIGYVLFDKENGFSEVEVVHNAQNHFAALIAEGTIEVPAGLSYRFAGNYEQQVRANKRLSIVVPIALAIIFLILYFQFKSIVISLMVFTGVFIAFAGGFIMIGLYDTEWFLDFQFFDTNMRELFQIQTINLSVAVWVGFLALFGIATDDGVLVATFLKDSFKKNQPDTIESIRNAVVEGGLRRVRPAMMTTATTILALLPILTSTGRGADIMLPMAIPSFGGMTLQVITMFTVPVLYSLWQEVKLKIGNKNFFNIKFMKNASLFFLICIVNIGTLIAQPLSTLQLEALEHNLELKVLEKEHLAAREKGAQVDQLADPELGIGAFPLPVETRLGSQILRLSASQMFPWFGTLHQKEEIELAKAKTILEQIAVKELDLKFQIEQSYLNLYKIDQSFRIIEKNLELLEAFENLALSKVEAGKTTVVDVLRVQLKMEELKLELKVLDAERPKSVSTINQILNRPMDQNIEIVDSFYFDEISFIKEEIEANIHMNHPLVKMFSLKQEISKEVLKLNDLNGKPSFGIGLDYIMVNGRSDMEPISNGRDIIQMKASVKIPLYRHKYEAKTHEEIFKIEALEIKKEDVSSQYMSKVAKAFADHKIAGLKLELYKKQLEITNSAIHILETEYSNSGEQFDELLRLENELIEYDLKILKAIVQSHLAKSEIKRLIIE